MNQERKFNMNSITSISNNPDIVSKIIKNKNPEDVSMDDFFKILDDIDKLIASMRECFRTRMDYTAHRLDNTTDIEHLKLKELRRCIDGYVKLTNIRKDLLGLHDFVKNERIFDKSERYA